MADRDRCPRCGALVMEQDKFCPQCGAPLTGEATGAAMPGGYDPSTGMEPRTIEELKTYCAWNSMPLEVMRFFVGEDYRQPRAFGIYRDGDQYIVYKNKSDGSRAVRYNGPDEAYAVRELYLKLLEECHNRGIWPDGKPEGPTKEEEKEIRRRTIKMAVVVILIVALMSVIMFRVDARVHAHDGYYRNDGYMYYRYGDDWYYDDDSVWVYFADDAPFDNYDDYYMGTDYDSSWGSSDFRQSSAYEEIRREHSSRTSSSDYSSWDSNDTDWDNDW